MELKLSQRNLIASVDNGSNRTFMELKYASYSQHLERTYGLIVPLWN